MSKKSIFEDTIAEQTYLEVDEAIKKGAIGLWAMGVIEQHGPHLPTGTDVYIPSARLIAVKKALRLMGHESIIIPPFYWGVNCVSSAFPASIKVRPEVMIELIRDVIKSFHGDGLRNLFTISGHNDRAHNSAIFQAMQLSALDTDIKCSFICDEEILKRLEIDLSNPQVLPYKTPYNSSNSDFLDIHAGEWETSIMLNYHKDVVKDQMLPNLKSTNLKHEDLVKWRIGGEVSKKITPLGYFGNPALATKNDGKYFIEHEAKVISEAIVNRLKTLN